MSKVYITDRLDHSKIEQKILGDYLTNDPKEDKEKVSILIAWNQVIDAEYLNNFPNVKAVLRAGAGYDKIDLDACRERGVVACNNPDYGTEEVAHTAVAMILNITRQVSRYDVQARDYRDTWQQNTNPATSRTNRQTVGFIGLGRIGSVALQGCQALRYETQFYDPFLYDGAHKVFNTHRCQSLEELLGTSDIVSLHCPLDKSNKGMIDQSFIDAMKPGASLVNTARGGLLDSLDLIENALKTDKLTSVALDVLPQEPAQSHPLIDAWRKGEKWLAGRLIINPHTAYYSPYSAVEMRENVARNARDILQGKPARNVVS